MSTYCGARAECFGQAELLTILYGAPRHRWILQAQGSEVTTEGGITAPGF